MGNRPLETPIIYEGSEGIPALGGFHARIRPAVAAHHDEFGFGSSGVGRVVDRVAKHHPERGRPLHAESRCYVSGTCKPSLDSMVPQAHDYRCTAPVI